MEILGRISQVVAFAYILICGCFLDSVNYMGFVYRIIAGVVWIVVVQAIIDPVHISWEED